MMIGFTKYLLFIVRDQGFYSFCYQTHNPFYERTMRLQEVVRAIRKRLERISRYNRKRLGRIGTSDSISYYPFFFFLYKLRCVLEINPRRNLCENVASLVSPHYAQRKGVANGLGVDDHL